MKIFICTTGAFASILSVCCMPIAYSYIAVHGPQWLLPNQSEGPGTLGGSMIMFAVLLLGIAFALFMTAAGNAIDQKRKYTRHTCPKCRHEYTTEG